MRFLSSLLLFCLLAVLSSAISPVLCSECHGKPDPNAQPNAFPPISGTLQFVRSVPNASLYTFSTTQDAIPIVHLWGSPYEKGVAHALLMKDQLLKMFNETFAYLDSDLEQLFTSWNIPPKQAEILAQYGMDFMLDLEILATQPFTGKYYMEEIRGMASILNGPQFPNAERMIQRLMLVGELNKGSCSMFGAWGSMLNPSSQLNLLQLRSLDWNMDGPFRSFPQITVYHYDSPEEGVDFANVGYTGFIGSLNGVNKQRISTSEIGVYFPDASFGQESRFGVPFTYLLRDLLQFSTHLQDGIQRISTANRTCDLILGLGDGKLSQDPFRGIEYSHSTANFFIDTNMQPYNESWHPRIPGVVYYGMDWLCPNYNRVLAQQLRVAAQQPNGSGLNAEWAIRNITSIIQSGSNLVSYYQYSSNSPSSEDFAYVSFAKRGYDNSSSPLNAYDRQFAKLNLDKDLFDIPRPSMQ